MYKVILILDEFFLKYEDGVKLTPPPHKKTTRKKPSFIRVKLARQRAKGPRETASEGSTVLHINFYSLSNNSK